MSERDNLLLLEDMLDAASRIKRYSSNLSYDSFIGDDKTVDATIRNFEVIGEAAYRIDPDFKNTIPEIDWKRIRGFRNRIVHDYFGIDYQIVWTIIKNDLDGLIRDIEKIILTYRNNS